MILKSLSFFSQNVHKNKLFTDTILENNKNFDILFMQKLPWSVIHQILSSTSEKREDLIGTSHYPFWIMFARSANSNSNFLRVIAYINIKLTSLCFLMGKDIFNHCNINLISFFNRGTIYFIMNISSDDHQNTLKYLKNTEVNLNNVLIMIGNFNIRDND